MSISYANIPQPEEIPLREKEDAMGSYLMMFAAFAVGVPFPAVNLIAAIIYYFINRNKSRFIKFHTVQSLYSQIPTTLMNWGLLFWIIRNLVTNNMAGFNEYFWGYVWTVVLANLLYVIFSIIAAVKARKGQMYYFLFFGRLSYHVAFRERVNDQVKPVNAPPK